MDYIEGVHINPSTGIAWKRKDITQQMVLSAVGKGDILTALTIKTKAPWKIIWRALERENIAKTIDYGVSLRFAWLTEKGIQTLKK